MPPGAVERAREIGHQRIDRGCVLPNAHRRDDVVDRCARRRPDAVSEAFTPAGDAFVSVYADQQHLERGRRLSSDVRHVAAQLHRHVDDVRRDLRDFHERG